MRRGTKIGSEFYSWRIDLIWKSCSLRDLTPQKMLKRLSFFFFVVSRMRLMDVLSTFVFDTTVPWKGFVNYSKQISIGCLFHKAMLLKVQEPVLKDNQN
jgi:hypothetical protein